MPKHEFGIIDEICDSKRLYEQYQPEKYGCIPVDDDYIEPLMGQLQAVDTYFHNTSRPSKGLAYCGITLIPPESLPDFKSVLISQTSPAYDGLIKIINKGIAQNKYMIHYGI